MKIFRKKRFDFKKRSAFSHGTPLQVIVFSKDRACQLDCLLRSAKDHLHYASIDYHILYITSTPGFTEGYTRLFSQSSQNIHWIVQQVFKQDVINIINNFDNDIPVMFLVDDNVFYKPVTLEILLNAFSEHCLFASLRVDRNYKKYKPPGFHYSNDVLLWEWKYLRKSLSTWHYPFSVDGNIFNSTILKEIVPRIDFKAPNSFEISLQEYRKQKWIRKIKGALAPPNSVLINIPMNKVQTEGETWNLNILPESLNEKFLAGFRIDLKKIYACVPDNIHFPAPVELLKSQ